MSKNIIEAIESVSSLSHLAPATEEDVLCAEKELGLIFAEDYKEYVLAYGVISGKGIELSGITHHKRLSVVELTKDEREVSSNIAADMYVIENLAIDGVITAQDTSGAVYYLKPGKKPEKVFDCLADYVYHAINK